MTGTYSIPAPGDTWEAADNGTYTVTLLEGAVEDTLNNATPETILGTFSVSISTATPGALEVSPAGGLQFLRHGRRTVQSFIGRLHLGQHGRSSLSWTAGKTQNWVSLSASSGTLAAGASTTVTVSINAYADSLTAGSYSDTVSFVNSTTGNGNTTRAVALTVNAPGQLEVTPAGGLSSSGTVGGPFSPSSVSYTLSNTGDSSLSWTAGKTQNWVSLSASSGTLAAGASTTVTVSINANADGLTAGSYSDTVSFVNSTTGNGNTTRAVALTVNAPGQLEVTPTGGLSSSGTVGGPFSPSSVSYTLSNTGGFESELDRRQDPELGEPVGFERHLGGRSLDHRHRLAQRQCRQPDRRQLQRHRFLRQLHHRQRQYHPHRRSHRQRPRPTRGHSDRRSEFLRHRRADGLSSSGTVGGPFSPSSVSYTLSNTGGFESELDRRQDPELGELVGFERHPGGRSLDHRHRLAQCQCRQPDRRQLQRHRFLRQLHHRQRQYHSRRRSHRQRPGQLEVTPADDLSSSGTVGGPFSPSSVELHLVQHRRSSLSWTAGKTQNWVSLSASSGTLAAGASTTVTVSLNANADSLTAGSYSDTVSFVNSTTGNGNTTRAVALTVNAPGQLEVTPADGLSSSGTVGGPFSPSSVSYTLSNSGDSSLSWTAGKTQNWVSLSASSGTLAAGASTTVTVSLNANADTLTAGSYSDTVSFVNSTTGNGNTTRAVALTVNAPGQLEVSPTEALNFSGYLGGPFTPSGQSYLVSNVGDTSLVWSY
jgi:hypothetical protein